MDLEVGLARKARTLPIAKCKGTNRSAYFKGGPSSILAERKRTGGFQRSLISSKLSRIKCSVSKSRPNSNPNRYFPVLGLEFAVFRQALPISQRIGIHFASAVRSSQFIY
jgi:hypothetical protein